MITKPKHLLVSKLHYEPSLLPFIFFKDTSCFSKFSALMGVPGRLSLSLSRQAYITSFENSLDLPTYLSPLLFSTLTLFKTTLKTTGSRRFRLKRFIYKKFYLGYKFYISRQNTNSGSVFSSLRRLKYFNIFLKKFIGRKRKFYRIQPRKFLLHWFSCSDLLLHSNLSFDSTRKRRRKRSRASVKNFYLRNAFKLKSTTALKFKFVRVIGSIVQKSPYKSLGLRKLSYNNHYLENYKAVKSENRFVNLNKYYGNTRRYFNFFKFSTALLESLTGIWLRQYRFKTTSLLTMRDLKQVKFDYLAFNITWISRKLFKKGFYFKYLNNRRFVRNFYPKQFWVSKLNATRLNPYRFKFILSFGNKLKYQKRITTFVLKFYKFSQWDFLKLSEFSASNLIRRVGFIRSTFFSNWFFLNGFVYLNNRLVSNPQTTLSVHDVVQIPVYSRFFIMWEHQTQSERNKFRKFYYFTYKFRTRSRRPFPKKSSRRLPNWIKLLSMNIEYFPLSLEVDFTILTFIVLKFNYFNFFFYSYLSWNSVPFNNMRAFNWKYLT